MAGGDAMGWAAIAAGGAVGALLRWSLLRLASRFEPAVATLTANLIACGVLGAATAQASTASDAGAIGTALAAFLTIGLCGSLSTFSTLCGDLIRQLRSGSPGGWIASLAAHLFGGPLAFAVGSLLGR